MSRKKNVPPPLSDIDVNALGVSGVQPNEKVKKKRLSLKQSVLYSLGLCGLCFFITALFPSKPKPPAESVPTASALPTEVAAVATSATTDSTVAAALVMLTDVLGQQTATSAALAPISPTANASETALMMTGAAAYTQLAATWTQEAAVQAMTINQSLSATATITDTPPSVVISIPTTVPTQRFFPTALPVQGALETEYAQIAGITSVDMVSVQGGIAYAEITHQAGVSRKSMADQMLQKALQATADSGLVFSVIFTDRQTCEDYMFDLGTDDWRITPITCPASALAIFTPEQGLGVKIDPTTYYAGSGGANIRECTKTSCPILIKLAAGDALVTNYVVNGDAVETGNAVWYRYQSNGITGFVYSGVVSSVKPATVTTTTTGGGTSNGNQSGGSVPQSVPPAAVQQWSCGGDAYNCGDFSNRTDLMSYFSACPGDPSKLDGNNDGIPCESLR